MVRRHIYFRAATSLSSTASSIFQSRSSETLRKRLCMWMLKTGSRRRPVHRVCRNQKPDRLLCPVFRSGRHDSNMRPQHPKCRALPTALRPDNERHYIEQNVSPQNIWLVNVMGRGFFLLLKKRRFTGSWHIQAHDRAERGTAKHLSPESPGKMIFSSFQGQTLHWQPADRIRGLCRLWHRKTFGS